LIGAAAALPASRLVESFLFATQRNDPQTIGIAVTIMLVSALAAGYGPARRASRVDLLAALRHD
jgi:ABC-type antimicrobial peptide transport system permease subunit